MTIKLVVDGKAYNNLMKLFDNSIEALEKSISDFSFDQVPKALDKTIDFINKIVKDCKKKQECDSSEHDKCCSDDCCQNFCKDEECCPDCFEEQEDEEETEWFETVDEDDDGEDCDEYCGVSDVDHIS